MDQSLGSRSVQTVPLGRNPVVAEDNFSLQLQTPDGTFHFMATSDLEGLEYSSRTLMPSDYGSTLSPNELNDVVSYLMSVPCQHPPGGNA